MNPTPNIVIGKTYNCILRGITFSSFPYSAEPHLPCRILAIEEEDDLVVVEVDKAPDRPAKWAGVYRLPLSGAEWWLGAEV